MLQPDRARARVDASSSTGTRDGAQYDGDPPPEHTVDETIALHRDEWILMKVKGFDEDGWPERGLVLAHSPKRGAISERLAKEPLRKEGDPYEPYYIFNAFPRGKGSVRITSPGANGPASSSPSERPDG